MRLTRLANLSWAGCVNDPGAIAFVALFVPLAVTVGSSLPSIPRCYHVLPHLPLRPGQPCISNNSIVPSEGSHKAIRVSKSSFGDVQCC